jgi:hypothetical protein
METTVDMPVVASSEDNDKTKPASFELVAAIVRMLESLPREDQKHVLQTVVTWLHLADFPAQRAEITSKSVSAEPASASSSEDYPFSGRREITPKEFLLEKDPQTDSERMTCLGYYLTHFRDHPYFKTEDLSKLNTEAAQRKFANAALTAKNAVRDGFFVQAPKQGLRQLSALGEQYVQALPDHEAARLVRKRMRVRRRSNSKKESPNGLNQEEE